MTTAQQAPRRKVYLFKNKTVPKDPYHDLFVHKGFEPVFVPLLRHRFINVAALREFLESPGFRHANNAIIITSQRAIEAVNEAHEMLGAAARDVLHAKPVYTVGPASAAALERAGYTDVRGGSRAGNGSILSDIIMEENRRNSSSSSSVDEFVFFTGVTRRDIIPVKLRNAQFNLEERVVYQTLAIENLEQHVLSFISAELEQLERGELTEAQLEQDVEREIETELLADMDDGNGSKSNDVRGTLQQEPSPEPYYVFFSPAEADPVVEAVRQIAAQKRVRLAAIGPTTQAYLQERGMSPRVVASKPDAMHLVDEILEDLQNP